MKQLALMLTLLALTLSGAAAAQDNRVISVTGQGMVDASPDMATITLGVTNEAAEAATAMDLTSDAVGLILVRLDQLGVAPRDIQTRRLELSPVWSGRGSNTTQPPKITGFVARNTVMVRVRDLDGLGGILDAVVADGANDFNGLSFGLQDPQPQADAARRSAVEDAMRKAALLAEAAGLTLGPVQSISEQGGRPRPVMMEMAAARSDAVPVAPGELTVTATVSMVFAIAD